MKHIYKLIVATLKLSKIAKVLSNETNREIIKLLHQKPMTNMEIYNQIKTTIVCRESIFKALKKLVGAGLVEKFYDREKRLCYRLPYSKYVLDLVKETLEAKKKRG